MVTLGGFLGGRVVKNWPVNTGDPRDAGLIPVRKTPWRRNGNHLRNLMDREAWQATIHGVAKKSEKT